MVSTRRFLRVPLHQKVWCESERVTLFAPMVNISEGGLFVRTLVPLSPGTEARVRFSLPGSPAELVARAAVVWARGEKDSSPPGMGLRWVGLDEEVRERLRQVVAQRHPGPRQA